MNEREFLTCEDVAKRYRVSVKTIWDWIRQGKLSAFKLGKSYYLTEDDLAEFEKRHRIAARC